MGLLCNCFYSNLHRESFGGHTFKLVDGVFSDWLLRQHFVTEVAELF